MIDKKGRVYPNRVWFSLTGKCNNNCNWCYRKGSEVSKSLDPDLIAHRSQILAQCGTKKVTLIGGEPSLHKNHKDILRQVTKEIGSCSFVTNGRIFSKEVSLKWCINEKSHFIISLHGANPKHYKDNTGSKNGFKETIFAIKKMSLAGVRISVNVVLGATNISFIREFIEVVSKTRANILCFTIAIPSIDNECYDTDPLDIVSKIESIHNLCEEFGQKHLFIFSLPWCLLSSNLLNKLIANKNLMFNCPVDSGSGIVIKENGAILTCTHLSSLEIASPEQADEIFRSKKSFLDFWNSPDIIEFRDSVNVYRHSDCKLCIYRLNCKGGCPLWWKYFNFKSLIKKQEDCF